MDILSFLIGYILGATTTIWITGIFINSEKIQTKIKENWQMASKILPQKQAQVIKRQNVIDELLNIEEK